MGVWRCLLRGVITDWQAIIALTRLTTSGRRPTEGTLTLKTVQALLMGPASGDRINALGKIRDTLGVPDAESSQTFTTATERCLPGTGNWVWTHEKYVAWTSLVQDKDVSAPLSPHTLLLMGHPSSGKTSVAALIAQRLEKQKEDGVYVAHYFFSSSTQKAQANSVLTALKHSMTYQIARDDPTVLAALAGAADGKLSNDQVLSFWQETKIGTPGSGAVYYLVFDGLDYLSREQAKKLFDFVFVTRLAKNPTAPMRVLLSGTNGWFDTHMGDIMTSMARKDDTTASMTHVHRDDIVASMQDVTIWMEQHNKIDMRRVVEHALDANAREGSAQQRVYNKIIKELPEKADSYSQLQSGIDTAFTLEDRLAGARAR
ncbi:hypothetical protein FB45DRAFT_871560 [Roridomyces roridus]|uniref:Nephrocystin 3-like N-terminal domain-containing protein n=1 Tax=Roridomyces roridus TaxID=1738132 RepID=A0AAD7BFQ1_9AGAR|nr:hypothetical protein FB45DRAFT_871560 [Roridomyces roridus]